MLSLPVSVSPEEPLRSAAARVIAPRALVVDEEPQTVRGLKIMLHRAGYAVDAVETSSEALARLAASLPDGAVCYFVLPGGHGVKLCREVRRSAVGDEARRGARAAPSWRSASW